MPLGLIRVLTVSSAVLSSIACGGDHSPTGPTGGADPTTTAAPLLVVDGVSGTPVSVAGAPNVPNMGAELSLQAPGYLPRSQKFDGRPVALWPGDQSYVDALVYGIQFDDGSHRLTRWMDAFTITLDSPLATDPEVRQVAEQVVAEARRTTGLSVGLGAGGAVVVRVDPSDPMFDGRAVAYARGRYQGARVVGCDIVFRDRGEIAGRPGAHYRNTLLHEVGHALGLGHSPNGDDVMDAGGRTTAGHNRDTFSDSETGVLRMMYLHRQPGNRSPDADPGLFASSVRAAERVIVD